MEILGWQSNLNTIMLIYWIESVIEVEILQIKFLYTKADDLGEKFKNKTTQ